MSKALQAQGEIWYVQEERYSQVSAVPYAMDERTYMQDGCAHAEVAEQESSRYLRWAAGDCDCSAGRAKKRAVHGRNLPGSLPTDYQQDRVNK